MNLKIVSMVSFALFGAALMACSAADEGEQGANSDESNFVLGKSVGDECTSNWQCGGDNACRPNSADGGSGTAKSCQSFGKAGATCDEDADCEGAGGAKSKTKGSVYCKNGACARSEGTGGGH